MSVNHINNTGNISPARPVKPEPAGGQAIGRDAVQSNPGVPGRAAAPIPTPLLSIGSFITSELAELAQTVANRTALIKSLPADIKELVHNILNQTASVESTLPEGLAAILKSPKTVAEKLSTLATILEQLPELLSSEGSQAAGAEKTTQQQVLAKAVNAWRGKTPEELQAAAKVVRELAETTPRAGAFITGRQDNHSMLTFSVPLYFGGGQTAYPAHIHVYHQQEQDKNNPGREITETWLRICLETENIGVVETSFRLYDGHSLDVKVRFADNLAAEDFAAGLGEIKAQLAQLPLKLGEFLIR
ncbi:hypothetical protein SCACP_33320 [Sporomusa carbonis]|uniref:hypothetical protein n=1 Tax=Sporomusa carbonis TaxID=3076075 RepID=UPI003A742F3F